MIEQDSYKSMTLQGSPDSHEKSATHKKG